MRPQIKFKVTLTNNDDGGMDVEMSYDSQGYPEMMESEYWAMIEQVAADTLARIEQEGKEYRH